MSTLTEIRRQTDPALLEVVRQLSTQQIPDALRALDAQGRIHEIERSSDRIQAVAKAYVGQPVQTLVVAPDNESREQLNAGIRQALREVNLGLRGSDETIRVLVNRQDLTGSDRAWAGKYEEGDVLRYSKTSKIGVSAGDYATVTGTDRQANTLAVQKPDGSTIRYDPKRLQGVTVYRETERPFAVGDRIQFTAPVAAIRVANRELGTIAAITPDTVKVKLDDGRVVRLSRDQALHLDHGYAVTSHSSQGQTVDRVLIYIDPERAGQSQVNQRLAYVAVSRARLDAQIFCDDKPKMFLALNRQSNKKTAIDIQPTNTRQHTVGHAI